MRGGACRSSLSRAFDPMMKIRAFASFVCLFTLLLPRVASSRVWTEDDFNEKPYLGQTLIAMPTKDLATERTVVGNTLFRQAQKGDTFLDLARYYGLGYNDMADANPGVDPWVPPPGQTVILPTEFVLPDTDYRGIVVNIPEMRLYFFHPRAKGQDFVLVTTYPVGLGRDDWQTPRGSFKIRGKTVDPTWVIPDSIRAERIKEKGYSEKSVAGGSPDNPLGHYRLELTLPLYAIHGTNIPWGVGMQVSHGCIRLYPEDIAQLFPTVPVGTPGQFVYQPVKVGARNGDIYVQVHKDIYGLTPGPYREAMRLLDERGWTGLVDLKRLKRAVQEQSGVPMIISRDAASDGVTDEVIRLPSRGGRTSLRGSARDAVKPPR